jgi:hypothetical protein
MSVSQINRVFIARLAGTAVFDPNGDPVGKVRDAVATLRSNNQPPRILGLVVEVPLASSRLRSDYASYFYRIRRSRYYRLGKYASL